MSAKKKNTATELFKYDPATGQCIPLPLPWLFPSASEKKTESSQCNNTSNKKIVISPLKLSDIEESPSRPSKMRKINSVRKGLFNVPSMKKNCRSSTGRPSIGRASLARSRDTSKKVRQQKNPFELSPLLDMEEVEEELINKRRCLKGYSFKTPSKPSIKFTQEMKISPAAKETKLGKISTDKGVEKTLNSTPYNDKEFIELEKMCCMDEPNKENSQSPVSAVCNLLEDTVLNSVKKPKNFKNTPNILTAVNEIENILEENKTAFKQYKHIHEKNIMKISEILENDKIEYTNVVELDEMNNRKISEILQKLRNSCIEENDKKSVSNHNRRSVRLLNKSPVPSNVPKIIVSPAILKSGDLRKTTLTKNLVTNTKKYSIQSPRILKALDMYNSIRDDCSVLATPKLNRNALMDSPKSSNISRIVSRRVQTQCLLLQDTPSRPDNN